MSETDCFSHFTVRSGPAGLVCAVFHLQVPEWQMEGEAGEDSLNGEKAESVFDEPSLALRISNLSAAGQDRSMSEAALGALRAAKARLKAPAEPAMPLSLAAVAEAASDLIMVTTADLTARGPVVLYSNPAVTRLTGQPPDAFAGASWRLLLGAGADRNLATALETQLASGLEAEASIGCASGTGEAVQVQFRVTPLRHPLSGAITNFTWIGRLATRTAPESRLASPASPDRANGAADRAALLAVLENDIRATAASHEHGPCLALFSIERMDEIHQRFGEKAAAAVRMAVADRLAENARRADFVARTGENEFGIHMPGVMLPHGRLAVRRIRKAVMATAVETPAGPVEVTLRAGIAEALRGRGAEAATAVLNGLLTSAETRLREAQLAPGNGPLSKGGLPASVAATNRSVSA